MTLPVAPVSIIATARTGAGIGFPDLLRVASIAAPMAMRRSTTGPTFWRFATWEVNEGTSHAEEIGCEVLRCLDPDDLLHEEWDVAKPLIALSDGVHF